MSKRKLSSQVVIEYLDKWPNVPNCTLAKKIYAEQSQLFNNSEHVRGIIRIYRGRSGDRLRGEVKERSRFVTESLYNPHNLPVSEAEDATIFNLPKQYNRIGVFSDMHIPYHDVEAITVAINHCIEMKCNAIILNGDAIDFYQLSRFSKDPRQRDVAYELDAVASVIRKLNELFGKVLYKIGNHELRYEKYLRLKAPELLNVPEYQFENLMSQRGAKCEIIPHSIILAGKLPIIHGHEFQGGNTSAVNPARGMFLRSSTHGMVSHSHRTSQHTEKDLLDKIITVWSIGCLCGLHPEYAQLNKWNHGFAYISIDREDAFDVNNYRIHKGKVRQ